MRQCDITEEQLRQMGRVGIQDKCKQLGIPFSHKDSSEQLINSILLKNVKKRFTITKKKIDNNDQQHTNTMNHYNRGALEYALPWPIVQRILTLMYQYSSRCNCVHRDALDRAFVAQKRLTTFNPQVQDQHQIELLLHTNMMLQSEVNQHSLTRDQLCTIHQFNLDQGYEPSFAQYTYRWMRSMALLSKRVFAFISTTLFTNIVMDPTADTWRHITNNYCIIKQPKILTLVSPSSDTQLFFTNKSQSSSSVQFLKNVEKIYINNPHLVEKVATIRSLIKLTPSLRSLTINCIINQSVMTDLFKDPSMKTITSINIAKIDSWHMNEVWSPFSFGNLFQPTSSLVTKIILPQQLGLDRLDIGTKHNLQAISLFYQPQVLLKSIEFPNLRHVHIVSGDMIPDIPRRVDTITYHGTLSLEVIDAISKLNISTLRVKPFDLEKSVYLNKITSLKKIVLLSSGTIFESHVNHFKQIGFDYDGSSFSEHSNTRKAIFIKKDGETNHSALTINNNNNNNNNNIQMISTLSSSNNNNIILPNTIINKIIKMTWKLRERCTCVYEKETIQKWVNIGYDILKDEQELDRFNQMKNNCPTHFSHTQPYKPLTYDLKNSNRSKLQLTLINKDIFDYISKTCFSVINLDHFGTSHSQTIDNPYCVAFKHFTTLKGNIGHIPRLHLEMKDNLQYITKVVLFTGNCLQDIIKLLPNLTTIDKSKYSVYSNDTSRGLDITNLHQLKYLTKLDLSTQISKGSLLDEIKDMSLKKLCLAPWYTIPQLPYKLRQSITKITAYNVPSMDQFPNLNHVVINDMCDAIEFKLPNTVTKVTTYRYQIDFLAHNKSVRQLKLKGPYQDSKELDKFIKTISTSEYSHVQTLVYCGDDTFQVSRDLFNDFNYQIDYSRTSLDYNMAQYLKLSRINKDLDKSVYSPSLNTRSHHHHHHSCIIM
ncbi:hypothetical protein DFA_11345 [Cavenderia fasciculata]|uniref:Uncharacterized protein n=1 Tax=Cavenderia fasciculata TaxID=261658 RepID=F4QCE9_CACFS|nr:uncharacterized protein DFA_11345 [Cavenderia fasciculata]EGG13584.1 hypothetical protein DFA_11345 [Cavenderia fasciculata]|eukprot:XP_004350288.1 hypothetical protein DFA_11345 [Cavenderia fasciculata]